ncbi:MAG: hypothetical protein MRZ79_02720 [Bacteroidia bacterium]|nr:hypothetical protein [Bacteroidia bacterium]
MVSIKEMYPEFGPSEFPLTFYRIEVKKMLPGDIQQQEQNSCPGIYNHYGSSQVSLYHSYRPVSKIPTDSFNKH